MIVWMSFQEIQNVLYMERILFWRITSSICSINPVDLMFETLKKKNPDHFAVRQYAKFKLAAGKTAKPILISCGARLAIFDIQELRENTAYGELELDTIGDRKTALFLIMSDTDSTFNFPVSMGPLCLY